MKQDVEGSSRSMAVRMGVIAVVGFDGQSGLGTSEQEFCIPFGTSLQIVQHSPPDLATGPPHIGLVRDRNSP